MATSTCRTKQARHGDNGARHDGLSNYRWRGACHEHRNEERRSTFPLLLSFSQLFPGFSFPIAYEARLVILTACLSPRSPVGE